MNILKIVNILNSKLFSKQLHKSYTIFLTPLKPMCYKGLKLGYY